MAGPPAADPHGGNRIAISRRLGCRPEQLLEASASLVPFGPPASLMRAMRRAVGGTEAPPDPISALAPLVSGLAALRVPGAPGRHRSPSCAITPTATTAPSGR